jgi:transposase
MPRRLLSLPDWKIHKIRENDHDILVHATPPRPDACQRCGVVGARLHKVGKFPLLVMDAPIPGKRVGICINRDRYRCTECDKRFYYRPRDIYQIPNDKKKTADGKKDETSQQHEITLALRDWIWEQSLRRNFHDVA